MSLARPAERSVEAAHGPRPLPASRPAAGARGVRNQILEAALVEFADKGFQEASLAAIARRLGVTAPLVLYHFGSKANLWREALEVFCGSLGAAVHAAAEEGRALEAREALRLMVRRLVEFFATHRAAYRLIRDEAGVEAGQNDWFTSRNVKPIIETIEEVYRRAVDEGAVRPAPFETTFFMILGAVSCYFESRSLAARLFGSTEEGAQWVDGYAEQVVRLCFDGLSMPARPVERQALATLRTPPRAATTTEVTLR